MILEHAVTHWELSLEFWHQGTHRQLCTLCQALLLEQAAGKSRQGSEPLKAQLKAPGQSRSFIYSLVRSFSQQIFKELVPGQDLCMGSIMNQIQSLKEQRVHWKSRTGHEQLLYRAIGGMIKLQMECCGGKCEGYLFQQWGGVAEKDCSRKWCLNSGSEIRESELSKFYSNILLSDRKYRSGLWNWTTWLCPSPALWPSGS